MSKMYAAASTPRLGRQLALRYCALLLIVSCASNTWAQGVGINASGVAPDPAAVLDVSTGGFAPGVGKGVLLPAVTLPSTWWNLGTPPAYTDLGGPFMDHTVSGMQPSLWVYNTASFSHSLALGQYTATPGHYVWDSNTSMRWLKQQAKVLAPQHHATTGGVVLNNTVWTVLPGATTVPLQLRAGDRVLFSANGTFRLAPPVAPATTSGYATAAARVTVFNGSTHTPLKQAVSSAMNDASLLVGTSGCILVWCAGNTGYYTTTLKVQSWRLLGAYDVPADGSYTFYLQASRLSGTADVTAGGDGVTNPELRGFLNVEVIRP